MTQLTIKVITAANKAEEDAQLKYLNYEATRRFLLLPGRDAQYIEVSFQHFVRQLYM